MFAGFANTGRIQPSRTDMADGKPVKNVNVRTKPQHTDVKLSAESPLDRKIRTRRSA